VSPWHRVRLAPCPAGTVSGWHRVRLAPHPAGTASGWHRIRLAPHPAGTGPAGTASLTCRPNYVARRRRAGLFGGAGIAHCPDNRKRGRPGSRPRLRTG